MAASDKGGGLTVDAAVEKIGFGRFQLGLVAICGTVQAADAMEMILLSFLGRSVQCQWHLSSHQIAWLATCVFIGTILGAPILGGISDRYGRWNALLLSACLIAYYGALSAASPSLPWILMLRGFVGFAVGGLLPLTSTLTSEFLPVKYRASFLVVMMMFWTLGGLLEVLVAWLCLGSDGALVPDGWRRMLAATSIPLFLVLPMFAWLPRSPRFLLASGRHDEALAQLNRVARSNGRPELTEPITNPAAKEARADVMGLFANPTLIRLTLTLLVFWFCGGFLYYGLVLLTTELPGLPHRCLENPNRFSEAGPGKSNTNCCQALNSADYATAALATLGEFFGYLVVILFIDTCGRRAVISANAAVLCALLVCMLFCVPPKVLTALLFLARGCSCAAFTAIYIYTNEAYPTTIRTLGMGVCCGVSRIGALLSPFVAQVLLPDHSVMAGLLTYAAVALVATVVAALFPFETKGRSLYQTVEETEDANLAATGSGASAAATEDDGLIMNEVPNSYRNLDSVGAVGGDRIDRSDDDKRSRGLRQ